MLANKQILSSLYRHIRNTQHCKTPLMGCTVYLELQRTFPSEIVHHNHKHNINIIYRSWNHLTDDEKKSINQIAEDFGHIET